MTSILRNIHIDEVSLVYQGADPYAHIVMAKSAGAKPAVAITAPTSKGAHMSDLNKQLAKALDGVAGAGDLSSEIVNALNIAFPTETPEVDPKADVTPPTETPTPDPTATPAADVTPTPDPTATPAPASTPAADATSPEGTPAPDASPEGDGAVLEAAVTKAVSTATAKMQKELDETTSALAKATETREIGEHVEKIRKDLPGLTVDADVLGAAMYRMGRNEMTDEDRTLVLDTFGAASALGTESPAFIEYGTAQVGDDSPGATIAKIATANSEGKTQAQAIADALETPEGREAYEADLVERSRRL